MPKHVVDEADRNPRDNLPPLTLGRAARARRPFRAHRAIRRRGRLQTLRKRASGISIPCGAREARRVESHQDSDHPPESREGRADLKTRRESCRGMVTTRQRRRSPGAALADMFSRSGGESVFRNRKGAKIVTNGRRPDGGAHGQGDLGRENESTEDHQQGG